MAEEQGYVFVSFTIWWLNKTNLIDIWCILFNLVQLKTFVKFREINLFRYKMFINFFLYIIFVCLFVCVL